MRLKQNLRTYPLPFFIFLFSYFPSWCQEKGILNNHVFQAKPVISAGLLKSDNSKILSPDDYEGIFQRGFQNLSKGLIEEAQKDFESVVYGAPEFGGGYYGIGLCFKLRGDTISAKKHLNDAVLKDAFFAPAHLELGDIQFASNPNEAKKKYLIAKKLMPTSAEPIYRLGLIDLHYQKINNARTKLRRGAELDPNHLGINYMLGRIWVLEGNFKIAEKFFAKCRIEDPENVDFIVWRVYCYTSLGNIGSAIRELDEGILTLPHNSILFSMRGALNYLEGKYLKAVNDFSSSLSQNPPGNSDFKLEKGLFPQTEEFKVLLKLVQDDTYYSDIKEQVDMAKVVSSIIVERNRTAFNTLKPYLKNGQDIPRYIHGVMLENQGSSREALKEYTLIKRNSPVFIDAQKRMGRIYFDVIQDNEKAYSIFQMLTIEDPTFVMGFKLKGNIHLAQGNYQDAIVEYNHAIKLDSTGTDLYFNRANCLLALDLKNESLLDFKKAVELNPRDADSWANMGYIQLENGDIVNAKHSLTNSVKLRYHPKAYFSRGLIYLQENNATEALKDFKKVDIHSQYFNAAQLNISFCFYSLNEFEKSITKLNTLIAKYPNEARAFYLRGLCHTKMKNYIEAEADFKVAKSLGLNSL